MTATATKAKPAAKPAAKPSTSSSTRADYVAKMKLQLDALNSQIDTLEKKVGTAHDTARETYEAELVKLRAQSNLAVQQMAKLKLAGEQTWDKVSAEMDKIHSAFVRSFHYFKAQL